jgi:signal transduction histidine kinase
MWDWLALAAVCGLLCIAGLGYALHLQLARQRRSLAATLESAIRGESTSISPELGEFSQAIEAAQRAGREVHLARDRSARDRGRFVTLGEILNVGVLMTNRAGELEFASARGRQMFGCEDDAHLATRLNEMRGTFDEALRRRTRDGRDDVRLDVEPARDSDGRHLRLEVYPLDHGTTEGRLILVRDRTNMKALETDLRLASQLRGLARLYLTVVHDIRAPLAALVAHTELLGRSLDDESGSTNGAGERRRGYIAVMEDELQRLRRSLDSLLNHATLPRDELEELDARELISDLEVLLRPQCDRQKVALSASVPDTPIRVLGTRDALKQALVNIGINALEAMPGGGALALRLEAADARAVVSVADTGGGIPPSVRDKIFTMHFTTKSSGTGIGLYVARAVVESNGGEIHVSSDVGHGTTFEIDLPALATGG